MRKCVFAVALFAGMPARACGCSKPRTPDDVAGPVPIFVGRAKAIQKEADHSRDFPKRDTSHPDIEKVEFEVLEQSRVFETKRVSVALRYGGTSCDSEALSFERGDVFLVSTRLPGNSVSASNPDDSFSGNDCDRRKRLKEWRAPKSAFSNLVDSRYVSSNIIWGTP